MDECFYCYSLATSISAEKTTMVGLVKIIYRNEGLTGFYRGLGPNFLKVTIWFIFIVTVIIV